MTLTLASLKEMHILQLRIRDIRARIEQAPKQLRRFQTRVENRQKELNDWLEAIKHLKVTIREKEVSIKTNEEKIAKYAKQRNEATTKKEYDAFGVEITSQKQANTKIEDEILEMMSAVEEKTAQIPTHEKALKDAQEELKKASEELAAQRPEWDKRLAEAQASLKELESQLVSDQKVIYDRLTKAYGADALAPVTDGNCAGCNVALTPQGRQNLDNGLITTCKNCGRLVYPAE